MLRIKPLNQTKKRQRSQNAKNQIMVKSILLLRMLEIHHVSFWRRQKCRDAIRYRISHEESRCITGEKRTRGAKNFRLANASVCDSVGRMYLYFLRRPNYWQNLPFLPKRRMNILLSLKSKFNIKSGGFSRNGDKTLWVSIFAFWRGGQNHGLGLEMREPEPGSLFSFSSWQRHQKLCLPKFTNA